MHWPTFYLLKLCLAYSHLKSQLKCSMIAQIGCYFRFILLFRSCDSQYVSVYLLCDGKRLFCID